MVVADICLRLPKRLLTSRAYRQLDFSSTSLSFPLFSTHEGMESYQRGRESRPHPPDPASQLTTTWRRRPTICVGPADSLGPVLRNCVHAGFLCDFSLRASIKCRRR